MAVDTESLLDAIDGIAYLADPKGMIVAVGATAWNQFAQDNGAPHLAKPDGVIGRRLHDFIQGDDVVAFYDRCLSALRRGDRRSVSFGFRCDAPRFRREMSMTISPLTRDGEVRGFLHQSQIVDERQRPPINLFDMAALERHLAADRNLPFVRICSFCHDVKETRDGEAHEWQSAEEYYRRGGTGQVQLSHGICPRCASRLNAATGLPD